MRERAYVWADAQAAAEQAEYQQPNFWAATTRSTPQGTTPETNGPCGKRVGSQDRPRETEPSQLIHARVSGIG